MADIKYEIVGEIGVLSENAKRWRKELNLKSWNDGVLSTIFVTGLQSMRRWEKVQL